MAETETTNPEPQADAPDAPDGDDGAVEVREAELPQTGAGAASPAGGQIDMLLDTTLSVEVQLGQVQTPARELLSLGPGSVLRLDKEAGEPVELLLRGVRFATGQLVVVGDRLGVRIKEIIPPQASPKAATKAG